MCKAYNILPNLPLNAQPYIGQVKTHKARMPKPTVPVLLFETPYKVRHFDWAM